MRTLTGDRYVRIGPLTVDLNRHILLSVIYRCADFTTTKLAFLWRRRAD